MLVAALRAFAPIAAARGDTAHAAAWDTHAAALVVALEKHGWDGGWYRRGFFDDGSPLGAAANAECRIDSIAQSWAVLSGAGDPARAAIAMAAVQSELVRPDDGLAVLFTPPFDHSMPNPGYIMGYPPGLRENGGQYTHAALWSVMAFAALGEGNRAGALYAMLNPINHARTPADVARYKVEPYVVAADIYAAPAHVGRGGWTWYTGSAAWMQRAGIESILGVRIAQDVLTLDPCIPADWPGFEVVLHHRTSRYTITVINPAAVQRGIVSASLDGVAVSGRPVQFALRDDDGQDHRIDICMG
jgi:cyclic beta-1,2-glucan synthetase